MSKFQNCYSIGGRINGERIKSEVNSPAIDRRGHSIGQFPSPPCRVMNPLYSTFGQHNVAEFGVQHKYSQILKKSEGDSRPFLMKAMGTLLGLRFRNSVLSVGRTGSLCSEDSLNLDVFQ